MLRIRHIVLALMLGAAAGCSDDSKGGGGSEQAAEGSVTVTISAEEGGEVKLGKAVLMIPPGALAEDLEITLEAKAPSARLPERATLQGSTYDFGPDGTEFEKPVTLELPLVTAPGADETAVVSWYDADADAWRDLPTTVEKGVVSAQVEHFTLFVVRFKDTPQGSLDCSFKACSGGNIEGTWAMAGACIETGEVESPFKGTPGCEDATFDVGADAEGEVTFADGTYEYTWTFSGHFSLDLSAECLEAIAEGVDCESFEPAEGVVCVAQGERCVCSGPAGEPDESSGTGTYEVSGSSITLTDDEDGTPETHPICVKGNEAKMQQTSTDIDDETGEEVTESTLLVLTRK